MLRVAALPLLTARCSSPASTLGCGEVCAEEEFKQTHDGPHLNEQKIHHDLFARNP
jgi:hypothetical protein